MKPCGVRISYNASGIRKQQKQGRERHNTSSEGEDKEGKR